MLDKILYFNIFYTCECKHKNDTALHFSPSHTHKYSEKCLFKFITIFG